MQPGVMNEVGGVMPAMMNHAMATMMNHAVTAAAEVTAAADMTAAAAVLRQGCRTAPTDHQHGDHCQQDRSWDDSRAHVRPLIIGPGGGRSTAVLGVSKILGTVQRPILPCCVGNALCSSNGAQLSQPKRVELNEPYPRHGFR